MALFRKKNDEDDQPTAETPAVTDPEASQPTEVRPTVEPSGGSFIPGGGAPPPEKDAKVGADDKTQTAKAVDETAERATQRTQAARAPEPEPVTKLDESESPRQAQRVAEGLPKEEAPGGRATTVRQSPAATRPSPPPAAAPRESPLGAQRAAEPEEGMKPEVAVGVAFAGGFLLAQVIKWLGGDDDE